MLHKLLARVAQEYTFERTKAFSGSEFGNFVRHDLAIEAKKQLTFLPFDLNVKASVGAGVWAAVPWLGFFDPIVTTSATTGFYVVYLINPDAETIYLSLNQGTTAIYREFGETRGREVLKRRAIDISERIPEYAKVFDRSAIDLGSNTSLPLGYEAGHAFGRKYDAKTIGAGQFEEDLEKMLYAYEALIDRGGITPTDTMSDEAPGETIEETRKSFLSKRIERSPNVRPRVLERRGIVCEACGFDPKEHAAYQGPVQNVPLDVHHAIPIMTIKEGESRRYKIPDDFLVLCPTCHRLIHMQDNPSDVDKLRNTLSFIRVPKAK